MEPRVVATGLAFPEGPLELPGGDILVTEIRAGQLTRVTPEGQKTTVAFTDGGPNGAALGPDGAIYVTNNGGFEWHEAEVLGLKGMLPGDRPADYIGGQIQRVTLEGEVRTLYRSCDGEPLKGPNDLVFDREGNFYFTDLGKTYGHQQDRTGVFYASPDGKMIKEIVFPLVTPNGCALSPDEKTLYVGETMSGRVWAFDLVGPGEVGGRRVVGTVPGAPPMNFGLCDSMCVDGDGNVLQATILNGGVTILAADGSSIEHVPTGDMMTTNCCFGGPDLRTLYVTASLKGELLAFDDWPVAGHRLAFQA